MNGASVLAVAGAIEKDKFKTTVSRISPKGREIVSQEDHTDLSVKGMAKIMRDLVQVVFPQQQKLNRESGKAFAVPVIMGWERGGFFSDLDETLKSYPNDALQTQHHKERDKGALMCAIDAVSEDMKKRIGLGSKIYLSRYSNVLATGLTPPGFKPKIDPNREALFGKYRSGASDANGGNDQLKKLRQYQFAEGQDMVNSAEIGSGRRLKADDDMMDSRFTMTGNLNAGPNEKGLLQLWDLRRQFANGYKYQAGIKPSHVLCVKEFGVDSKERPLQNVAEATAYQLLINDGSMSHSDLEAPYV